MKSLMRITVSNAIARLNSTMGVIGWSSCLLHTHGPGVWHGSLYNCTGDALGGSARGRTHKLRQPYHIAPHRRTTPRQ